MSTFIAIAKIYSDADAVFATAEQQAFDQNDDAAFDVAEKARGHNDQAYFLYLFTRLEAEINNAVEELLQKYNQATLPWKARRIWQAWSREKVKDIPLLSKTEVLTEKGRQDYATIKEYYDGRNKIAHGGKNSQQFFVPDIAVDMDAIVSRFEVN